MALLGWEAGLLFLAAAAIITFYSYTIFSRILDHYAINGRRLLCFRDMAHHILGANWNHYFVGPLQILICFAEVVAGTLLAGQSMKAIYMMENPDGTAELYLFIIISGVFMLILSQMPSYHSLRHLNFISLLLSLAYSACATAGSIHIGSSSSIAHGRDYSILGDTKNRIFGAFSAISVTASAYGNCVIPEIQATVAAPVKGKMFKGLCLCYTIIIITYFSVSISGYWAFGNRAHGIIFSNFILDNGRAMPKWFLVMSNFFLILQTFAVTVAFLQPTNQLLEKIFADARKKQYSSRNVIPRVIGRSVVAIIATFIAAMLPFFRDIIGLIGAFGFLPLVFVMPIVMHVITFKPTRRGFAFCISMSIIVIFLAATLMGCIAAVREIVRDANTYMLFANV
ncbi:GABA transporter 1 [Platanthera zijinensis]|uniref:GABA transporter 1 n=1 Tax=Platanthera zijinensis TaxID=2320716 RepID=A0AAP0GBJ4_9ASPA